MNEESRNADTVAATFEKVLSLIRPKLQARLGAFEATQLLQEVRDEWHRTAGEVGDSHG